MPAISRPAPRVRKKSPYTNHSLVLAPVSARTGEYRANDFKGWAMALARTIPLYIGEIFWRYLPAGIVVVPIILYAGAVVIRETVYPSASGRQNVAAGGGTRCRIDHIAGDRDDRRSPLLSSSNSALAMRLPAPDILQRHASSIASPALAAEAPKPIGWRRALPPADMSRDPIRG